MEMEAERLLSRRSQDSPAPQQIRPPFRGGFLSRFVGSHYAINIAHLGQPKLRFNASLKPVAITDAGD